MEDSGYRIQDARLDLDAGYWILDDIILDFGI